MHHAGVPLNSSVETWCGNVVIAKDTSWELQAQKISAQPHLGVVVLLRTHKTFGFPEPFELSCICNVVMRDGRKCEWATQKGTADMQNRAD